jgi:hypothetical protein
MFYRALWADVLLVVTVRLAVQLVNHARNWTNVSRDLCKHTNDNSQAMMIYECEFALGMQSVGFEVCRKEEIEGSVRVNCCSSKRWGWCGGLFGGRGFWSKRRQLRCALMKRKSCGTGGKNM